MTPQGRAALTTLRRTSFTDMGRILGIDYGLRRVGAALSDPGRSIATPLEVYERRSPDRDARHYRELVAEEGIARIVVGLPVHASGEEGEAAHAARVFGSWLAEVTGRPVVYVDERYTTAIAEEILRDSGVKASKRKALRDRIAAQVLLQAYLDAGCPEVVGPPPPLLDEPDGAEQNPGESPDGVERSGP